ncbi:SgcJ/EcaC family oxidoreductase [Rhodococcus sp. NCIMB 12038]|uniref:SgcJ/EcaC family oxidoreductase n=1 Tax=Rhodococcus sp. NCIMB 12038 TaxID=933800 RepID=UPI00117BB148|nr:SgcJ/EcaC family oxidoreductase [Rhodococcus sp. NCIMB 12038]
MRWSARLPSGGRFPIEENRDPSGEWRLSCADVAAFIVDQIDNESWIHWNPTPRVLTTTIDQTTEMIVDQPRPPADRTTRTDKESMPPAPEAVVSVAQAFVDAFNAHDPSAIADLFVPTGWFVDVVGHRLSGRDEIREAHRFAFSKMMGAAHLDVTDLQSRPLGDRHAQIEIAWTTTGHANPDGSRGHDDRHGLLVLTLGRESESDGWAIVAGANNDYSFVWSNTGPRKPQ